MTVDPFIAGFGDLCEPPAAEKDCPRCGRTHHVCICAALPAARVPTAARVVILQHPIETERRLGTVPLIGAAVAGVDVCVGRRFDGHRCPAPLRSALDDAARHGWPVLLLFPGADAVDVGDAAAGTAAATAAGVPPGGTHAAPRYVLIVIDGTWRHAKQLFTSVAPHVLRPGGPATRVGLPIGNDANPAVAAGGRNVCTETGTITLFKEPMPGCMTTAEAVARALAVLEPPMVGDEKPETPATDNTPPLHPAAAAILAALHAVVDNQKAHDPAVTQRCGGGGPALTRTKARFGFRTAPPNDAAPTPAPWKRGSKHRWRVGGGGGEE